VVYIKSRVFYILPHQVLHGGISAAWRAIKAKYLGFGRRHVEEYIKSCDSCQRFLPAPRNQELKVLIVKESWEKAQMDCVDMRNIHGW
jgi:hypothetical protein